MDSDRVRERIIALVEEALRGAWDMDPLRVGAALEEVAGIGLPDLGPDWVSVAQLVTAPYRAELARRVAARGGRTEWVRPDLRGLDEAEHHAQVFVQRFVVATFHEDREMAEALFWAYASRFPDEGTGGVMPTVLAVLVGSVECLRGMGGRL